MNLPVYFWTTGEGELVWSLLLCAEDAQGSFKPCTM